MDTILREADLMVMNRLWSEEAYFVDGRDSLHRRQRFTITTMNLHWNDGSQSPMTTPHMSTVLVMYNTQGKWPYTCCICSVGVANVSHCSCISVLLAETDTWCDTIPVIGEWSCTQPPTATFSDAAENKGHPHCTHMHNDIHGEQSGSCVI